MHELINRKDYNLYLIRDIDEYFYNTRKCLMYGNFQRKRPFKSNAGFELPAIFGGVG